MDQDFTKESFKEGICIYTVKGSSNSFGIQRNLKIDKILIHQEGSYFNVYVLLKGQMWQIQIY